MTRPRLIVATMATVEREILDNSSPSMKVGRDLERCATGVRVGVPPASSVLRERGIC